MEFIRAEGETDEMYRERFLERAETIKSQEELNTCNDGKRKTDVLIATIEKCEKLEEKLKIAKETLEKIKTTATFGKLKGINVDTPDNMRLKAIVALVEEILKKIKE